MTLRRRPKSTASMSRMATSPSTSRTAMVPMGNHCARPRPAVSEELRCNGKADQAAAGSPIQLLRWRGLRVVLAPPT
jgi:hypothetical protein